MTWQWTWAVGLVFFSVRGGLLDQLIGRYQENPFFNIIFWKEKLQNSLE